MDSLINTIQSLITKYNSDYNVSEMCVSLAIEIFKDIRNYPTSYTAEMIEQDMENNATKIAMAAIELDAKQGVENQTAHGESGISRTYSKNLLAYSTLVGFVTTI